MSDKIYKMNLPEKVVDYVDRNTISFKIKYKETTYSGNLKQIPAYIITFYTNSFGLGRLKSIFSYWGLYWIDWVLNFDILNNDEIDLEKLYDMHFKTREEKIEELKDKIVNNFHDIECKDEVPDNIISKIESYIDNEWNQDLEDRVEGYSNFIQIWIKKQQKNV